MRASGCCMPAENDAVCGLKSVNMATWVLVWNIGTHLPSKRRKQRQALVCALSSTVSHSASRSVQSC